MISPIVLLDPSDSALITVDWSDILATGITLTAVDHTVPSPLTRVGQTFDGGTGLSQVKVSGAAHGVRYMIEAQATLSNGEIINRQFPALGWNS